MRFSNIVGWLSFASTAFAAGVSKSKRLSQGHAGRTRNLDAHLGTFLHNRISPNYSELYIAEADGSNEKLLLGSNSVYDFRASWSPNADYVYFTSERRGDGQSDVYRIAINGTSTKGNTVEPMALSPGVDDSSSISPDGKMLAFTTSRFNQTSQIMLMVLAEGSLKNLTLSPGIAGAASDAMPNGYFKPIWSPDGLWIAFTSDRNTPWRGHSAGSGWEHTQELSIYACRPNGSDFHLVSSRTNYTQGSPRFSPDSKRLVFYEMLTEDTYDARLEPELLYSGYLNSSIVSIDFHTGGDRIVHASGAGTKISPSFVTNDVSEAIESREISFMLTQRMELLGDWLCSEDVRQQWHILHVYFRQKLHPIPNNSYEYHDTCDSLPHMVTRWPVCHLRKARPHRWQYLDIQDPILRALEF